MGYDKPPNRTYVSVATVGGRAHYLLKSLPHILTQVSGHVTTEKVLKGPLTGGGMALDICRLRSKGSRDGGSQPYVLSYFVWPSILDLLR